MRSTPPFTLNQTGMAAVSAMPPNAHPAHSSGEIGGAAPNNLTMGVRRDFTFTPLFNPALTTNGQTGVPRG